MNDRCRRSLAGFAASLVAAGLVSAGGSAAAGCGSGEGDAVFNVFEGGKIGIPSYSNNAGTCNVSFSGSTKINVAAANAFLPQPTHSNQKACEVTPTGVTLSRLDLPPWPSATSSSDIRYEKSGSALPISNAPDRNVYRTIELRNGGSALFANVSPATPFIIDRLTLGGCNGATTRFEAADYFIRHLELGAGCNLGVAGSGTVNLYLGQGTTLNGGRTCINMNTCSGDSPPLSGQHPEQLAIYVYSGTLVLQNNLHMAASVYVHAGDFIIHAGPVTFIGEALAQNIQAQNNTDSRFHHQNTGVFDVLFAGDAATPPAGEYSLAPAAVPKIGVAGDYAFLASQTAAPMYGGHLKAFALTVGGATSPTASWDAATQMDAGERTARLYSTDGSGKLVTFSALERSAFGVADEASAAALRSRVLSGPARALPSTWDSMLGLPNGTQPLIYRSSVVFSASDGFLYAASRSSGELRWGFMPRLLASGLTDYEGFLKSDPMQGQISAAAAGNDLEDEAAADQAGYLVATARGGALHYGLSVGSDGSLGGLAWLDARQLDNSVATDFAQLSARSPNAEAPMIFDDRALYIVNHRIVIRPYAGGKTSHDAEPKLGGAVATSSPLVAAANGSAPRTLYLGDDHGYVWRAELSGAAPGSFGKLHDETIGAAEAVRYLSITELAGADYLVAQSDSRITAFRRSSGDAQANWSKAWSSGTGGATEWVEGSAQSTSATGASTERIQALPAGARISDRARVAGGIVFVPITIDDPGTCSSSAYLYLFNLDDGHFPPGALASAYDRGTLLIDNLAIGSGAALRPEIMIFDGKLFVQGHSGQNARDAGLPVGGLDNPIELRGPDLGGRRGWKELVED